MLLPFLSVTDRITHAPAVLLHFLHSFWALRGDDLPSRLCWAWAHIETLVPATSLLAAPLTVALLLLTIATLSVATALLAASVPAATALTPVASTSTTIASLLVAASVAASATSASEAAALLVPAATAVTSATSSSEATSTTRLALRCLVHADLATVEFDVVHRRDSRLGILLAREAHEPETAATACIPVLDDDCFIDLPELLEFRAQGLIVGMPCEATDE